ncbi:unnamed protein product [Owenia fusiformis]|uniref:Uncharacterized protein n=1 Tax=Owenia fusiformis TaxID=6347 RepID=A0A8J1U060_OWEFU|nr:unnamed protein product [Owenia fusiformis]
MEMVKLLLKILLATFATVVTCNRPNIVIMLADDLGIGDVGCFGNDTINTPHIDGIAKEGVRLTHHLTAASVCTPSRAALLTGRYPVRSGMGSSNPLIRMNIHVAVPSGLPPSEVTIAEMLKQHGYKTAVIGKWHLGLNEKSYGDFNMHPLKQGFDSFYGSPMTNLKDFGNDGDSVIYAMHKRWRTVLLSTLALGLLTAFIVHRKLSAHVGIFIAIIVSLPCGYFYFTSSNMKMLNSVLMRDFDVVEQPIRFQNFTQRLVNEAREFLDARRMDKEPFLLYIPWLQVHTVLHTSPEFRGRSRHGKYGDNVEEMDWSVGEVVRYLKEFKLIDNTFVYFTSDNGGHKREFSIEGEMHGGYNGIYRGGKGDGGMDGGIRVPTVAMWKGHIPPGTIITAPTSVMDVFSTVAAITGANVPNDRLIDSVDILPLMKKKTSKPPHKFMYHYCGNQLHAVRYTPGNGDDVWKVHFYTPNYEPGTDTCKFLCMDCSKSIPHDPPLLYNIEKDPKESKEIDINSNTMYKDIIAKVNIAVAQHKGSVTPVVNQYRFDKIFWRPWLQPCCNFPHCNCIDPKYATITGQMEAKYL